MKPLTKDTSRGLPRTCRGLGSSSKTFDIKKAVAVCHFGVFTSVPLEDQFGKLRQGWGGTYFITVQQILEKVAKTKLLLNLDVNSDGFSIHSCDKCGYLLDEDKCNILDTLPDLEKELPSDIIMTLIYLAGYVGRNDDEIHDACFYYGIYGNYLKDMHRGELKIFGDTICQLTIYGYIIFHEVVDLSCRSSFCNILMLISEMYYFDINRC